MSETGDDDWKSWSKHVIRELERLNREIDTLQDKLQNTQLDVRELQVRAMLLGGGAGLGVQVLVYLIQMLPKFVQ